MKAILRTGNECHGPNPFCQPWQFIVHVHARTRKRTLCPHFWTTVMQAYNINLALSTNCVTVLFSLPNQQILMICVTMTGTSFLSGKQFRPCFEAKSEGSCGSFASDYQVFSHNIVATQPAFLMVF